MANMTQCWYNYRTCEYDWLDFVPDDLSAYVPQTFQMQDFYKHRLELGDSPLLAASKIRKMLVTFELDE